MKGARAKAFAPFALLVIASANVTSAGAQASRDSAARAQAVAATQLIRRGQDGAVWPMLRHSPDPTLRTYIVHEVASVLADASPIVRRLDEETDVSSRRALIVMLGHFSGDQLPPRTRQRVTPRLLQWYRDDPDPGIHGAIDWLLRHERQGERPRPVDWARAAALERIDRELAGRSAERRNWFVTREGQTLAIVRGSVEFMMGAPADELGRMPASDSPEEPLHAVKIPRSFAIGTKEVTVAQFRRFLDANPEVKAVHAYLNQPDEMARVLTRFSPEEGTPQIAVTWYEAAMYCNWLSKREGLPESEWIYPANPLEIRGEMILPGDYLRRTGYRLPTEAEWEFAARAGSTTSRFFGATPAHLKEYAWYAARPQQRKSDPVDPSDPQRTWPTGQLEPNELGLFDVYGNVWEWTQNRIALKIDSGVTRLDVEDDDVVVLDTVARPRRGGAFPYGAAFMRSANRGTVGAHPTTRRDNVGFRIARTIAP